MLYFVLWLIYLDLYISGQVCVDIVKAKQTLASTLSSCTLLQCHERCEGVAYIWPVPFAFCILSQGECGECLRRKQARQLVRHRTESSGRRGERRGLVGRRR